MRLIRVLQTKPLVPFRFLRQHLRRIFLSCLSAILNEYLASDFILTLSLFALGLIPHLFPTSLVITVVGVRVLAPASFVSQTLDTPGFQLGSTKERH